MMCEEDTTMEISKSRISGLGVWAAAAVLVAGLSAGRAHAQWYPGGGYDADRYAPAAPRYGAGDGGYEGERDWPRADRRERAWRREQYGRVEQQRREQEVLREQQSYNQRLLQQQQANN